MKKILLTTDFSKNANQAIEYAMQLFKYDECQFYVLNVLKASSFISDDLMSMKPTSNLYNQLIDSIKIKLDNYLDSIKLKHNNILHEFIPIIDYDNLIAAVNQIVSKHDIKMIVMGTKGASNVVKKLIGSNTMHVMQGCEAAVLAIPDNYDYRPIKKVLFTSNYENKYCPEDLTVLLNLVEHHDYKVDILHILNQKSLTVEQEQVRQTLKDCFKNASHQFIEIEEGEFLTTIEDYAEKQEIDLFAMVNRKHGFWESLFSEQKLEKVAYKINMPLLVM